MRSILKNKLLSICIPTLNRRDELEKCLSSILGQKVSNELFDIVIVDGGSTDGTREFIQKVSKKNSNIFLYDSKYKNGVDNDILQSIRLSKSKFCWLFSDDDCFSDQLLSKVINFLSLNRRISGISLNYQGYDSEMIKKIMTVKATRKEEKTKNYSSLYDLFYDLGIHTGFISCQIINKKYFDMSFNKISNKTTFNNWVVPYIISTSFKEEFGWYFCADLIVKYRSANDSFINKMGILNRFELTFVGFRNILKAIFKDKKKVNKIMNYILLTRAPRTIVFLKSKGLHLKDSFYIAKILVNHYSYYPLLWLIILPLLILPNSLFFILKKLYFKFI